MTNNFPQIAGLLVTFKGITCVRWRGMDLNHQPRAYEHLPMVVQVPLTRLTNCDGLASSFGLLDWQGPLVALPKASQQT